MPEEGCIGVTGVHVDGAEFGVIDVEKVLVGAGPEVKIIKHVL